MSEEVDYYSELSHVHRKPTKLTCLTYSLTFLSALGGFLFGYDTGVVSGALVLLKVFVAITMCSALLFALVSGLTNDILGRKVTILVASVTFLIGSIVLAYSNSVAALLVGRFIVGVGIASVPMYIAECSPSHMRGRLVSVNNVFITGGQFIAALICGAFSFDKVSGWRYMLGIAAIPALIQAVLFTCMPESPRLLYSKGKIEEARDVLERIEGSTEGVEEELENIRLSLHSESDGSGSMKLLRIMKTPHVRRALFIGVMLQVIQQFVGINTVMYYSATIIQMSGIEDSSKAIWLASVTASVNFIFTFVGILLVDRIGRRKLVLLSLFGTFVSLLILGTGFLLSASFSPPVNLNTSQISTCSRYTNCYSCVTDLQCGYCYTETSHVYNGTCVTTAPHAYSTPTTISPSHVTTFFSSHPSTNSILRAANNDSGAVPCDGESARSPWKLAERFCPTQFVWMTTFGLVAYLAFFSPGMGPMPWTINSEIYPGWARSTGNSLASCANWLANLIVSVTFLTLTESITIYGAFYLYAGLAVVGLLFIFLLLPETKNKDLEEIENLFKRGVIVPFSKLHSPDYSELCD